MIQFREYSILIIELFVILQLIRRRYSLFDALSFLLPFQGIMFEVGVHFTLIQFVFLLSNIFILLINYTNSKLIDFRGVFRPLLLYFSVSVLITILVSIGFIDYIQTNNPNYLRNEGRFLGQLLNFSIYFSIFIITPNLIHKKDQIYRAIKIFMHGILLLALLGLLQQIFYIFTRIDIFPIPGGVDGLRIAQEYNYFGVPMIRTCSLGGEPKGFAQILVMGCMVLILGKELKIHLIKVYWISLLMLIISVIFTLSTSGFVVFFILWIVTKLMVVGGRIERFSYSSVILLFVILLGTYYFYDKIELIFEDRIGSRDIANEDWDAAVKSFLLDNPKWIIFGSGWGNIHNLAQDYIPAESLHYMEGNIFTAKSGYLKIISETGIVGFFLFLYFNYYIIRKLYLRYKLTKDTIFAYFYKISIIALIAYMARTYTFEFYLVFLSISGTLLLITNNSTKKIQLK